MGTKKPSAVSKARHTILYVAKIFIGLHFTVTCTVVHGVREGHAGTEDEAYLPHDTLSPGPDGSEVLIPPQNHKRRVADVCAVELLFSLVLVHGEVRDQRLLCIQNGSLCVKKKGGG